MRTALAALLALAAAAALLTLALAFRRQAARRRMWASWRALRAAAPATGAFDPEMVSTLPEPARRLLLHALAPGTPLYHRVELEMTGTIALRPGSAALPMEATQIIAWPRGYIWEARIGSVPARFSGFDLYRDGEAEMRWWLWDLLPIVRQEHTFVVQEIGEARFR